MVNKLESINAQFASLLQVAHSMANAECIQYHPSVFNFDGAQVIEKEKDRNNKIREEIRSIFMEIYSIDAEIGKLNEKYIVVERNYNNCESNIILFHKDVRTLILQLDWGSLVKAAKLPNVIELAIPLLSLLFKRGLDKGSIRKLLQGESNIFTHLCQDINYSSQIYSQIKGDLEYSQKIKVLPNSVANILQKINSLLTTIFQNILQKEEFVTQLSAIKLEISQIEQKKKILTKVMTAKKMTLDEDSALILENIKDKIIDIKALSIPIPKYKNILNGLPNLIIPKEHLYQTPKPYFEIIVEAEDKTHKSGFNMCCQCSYK